jgi:hypothetical protein
MFVAHYFSFLMLNYPAISELHRLKRVVVSNGTSLELDLVKVRFGEIMDLLVERTWPWLISRQNTEGDMHIHPIHIDGKVDSSCAS